MIVPFIPHSETKIYFILFDFFKRFNIYLRSFLAKKKPTDLKISHRFEQNYLIVTNFFFSFCNQ